MGIMIMNIGESFFFFLFSEDRKNLPVDENAKVLLENGFYI